MNATPNPEDINAIAPDSSTDSNTSSNAESVTLPAPPQNLGTFLDRLYGTLFLPQVTFEQLKAHPSFVQAAIVIALVNALEAIRLDHLSIVRIIGSVIGGSIGWVFFTFLLKQLANVFQKNVEMLELLTLTGFASLPWIFMAPALSLPPQSRFLGAIAVIIWFIVWQVWSASVALGIKSWKTLAIIPLAIAGGIVALIWLGNTIKLLLSISF
ncbi:YIP1 family protein [Pseudanabaena sp. Chao 1811]|uniref:YIP1 family protein n=1 Tax=Pseudanabaena sp. Chao 1811 TaxID=2963092 RepID=UPI0022F3F75B|nr:YIP1 family protein [Pseudanabaena sp. Chao 1811]